MKKSSKLGNILTGVSVAWLVWVLASYIDTITHNLTTYQYQWWNCFELFTKWFC